MAMLEVENLSISFGGLKAVDGFHISIEKGQLYGLIGPNGAGKTTVFNLLTGVYKPNTGSIVLDGQNITGRKTIEINQDGIARTFPNIRLIHACQQVKYGSLSCTIWSDQTVQLSILTGEDVYKREV